jgi:hypothetical protein
VRARRAPLNQAEYLGDEGAGTPVQHGRTGPYRLPAVTPVIAQGRYPGLCKLRRLPMGFNPAHSGSIWRGIAVVDRCTNRCGGSTGIESKQLFCNAFLAPVSR